MRSTLVAPAVHELDKIRGSRFLAHAAPIAAEADADACLARLRERHPDATHHCWSWRLGEDRFRWSDDGEPYGSAGRPIFNQLVGRHLHGVLVVVIRWYGGTKLGTGGLVRAYGAAASEVLDRADLAPWRDLTDVHVRFGYEQQGAVDAVLHAFHVSPSDAEYAADVRLVVPVPAERVDAFVDELRERTAGRAAIAAG